MKKYDIFLFDADNTLYDYDLAEKYALSTMLENHGISYSAKIHEKYREINADVWGKLERGQITKTELQSIRFELLFKHIGANINARSFNDGYVELLGKASYLIEGAQELCKLIVENNKKLYIVTNGLVATHKARLKHSTISKYFSGSFVSELIGYEKPHIKYFDHVFSLIPSFLKNSTLMVGDNLRADIAGGINAGIDTCWFNLYSKKNNTGIKATYEILKLNELHSFV